MVQGWKFWAYRYITIPVFVLNNIADVKIHQLVLAFFAKLFMVHMLNLSLALDKLFTPGILLYFKLFTLLIALNIWNFWEQCILVEPTGILHHLQFMTHVVSSMLPGSRQRGPSSKLLYSTNSLQTLLLSMELYLMFRYFGYDFLLLCEWFKITFEPEAYPRL